MKKIPEAQLQFLMALKSEIYSQKNQKIKYHLSKRFDKILEQTELTESDVLVNDTQEEVNVVVNHNPLQTLSFLSLFTNENAFKYLTHAWTSRSGLTYNNVINNAIKVFKENDNENSEIAQSVFSLVGGFIGISGKGFIDQKNERRNNYWLSPTIKLWCETNAPAHPQQDTISGLNTDFIEPFKQVIEIRDGFAFDIIQQELKRQGITQENDWDITITKEVENLTAYTNVFKISEGLEIIFRTIVEKTTKQEISKKITIDLTDDIINDKFVAKLQIFHHNSGTRKAMKASEDLRNILKNDMLDVWNHFFGLVDWSIESDFSNAPQRVHLLTKGISKKVPKKVKHINDINFPEKGLIEGLGGNKVSGFKHIITFYL